MSNMIRGGAKQQVLHRSRQAIFYCYSIVLFRLMIFDGGLYDSMSEGSFRSLPIASVFIMLFLKFFLYICVT